MINPSTHPPAEAIKHLVTTRLVIARLDSVITFDIAKMPRFFSFNHSEKIIVPTPGYHCYLALVEEEVWEENGKETTYIDFLKGPITSMHGLSTAKAAKPFAKDSTTHPQLTSLLGEETVEKIEILPSSQWFTNRGLNNLPNQMCLAQDIPHVVTPTPLEFFTSPNLLNAYPIHNPHRPKRELQTGQSSAYAISQSLGEQFGYYWWTPKYIEVLYKEEDVLTQWNKLTIKVLQAFNQKAIPYSLGTCNSNSMCYSLFKLLFGPHAEFSTFKDPLSKIQRLGIDKLVIPEKEIMELRERFGFTHLLSINDLDTTPKAIQKSIRST